VLPASTANMPLALECPTAHALIAVSSAGTAAPVATTLYLIDGWDFSVAIAPSIRGWMFAEPGVAMNSAISPDGTSETMWSPIC